MSNAMLIRLWLVALLSFGISSLYASDSALPVFHFGHISAQDGLPTDEVRQIYQDKDGYIWIATNSGLCQYDGYQIKTYKSNLHTPGLLSNNTICCVAEDNHHNLWIAAYDGVNVLNKTTGHIRKIDSKELRRSIVDRLLVTATDRIFIGTEAGVFEYFPEKDSCVAFKPDVLKGSVKAMIEDSNHNLWIGTWSDGFYRYDPEVDKVFAYPVLNGRNSAYDIFEDSKQRIWIGSWGYGLFLLENPYEPERLSWKQYKHDANNPNSLCDDIIYDIDEDLNTGTLWIGTRNGLSILYNEAASLFQSYRPDNSETSVYHNEISSVFRDREGMMWLGLLGGGVNTVITRKPEFSLDRMDAVKNPLLTNSSVRSILVDRDGLIWLGLGSWGFFVYNRIAGTYTHNLDMPEFKGLGRLPIVNTIIQSPTSDKIWLGTYDWGIVSYDKTAPAGQQVRLFNYDTDYWLTNQCVFSIFEDKDKNTWFGTRNGICVLTAGDKGVRFDSFKLNGASVNAYAYLSIVQDSQGRIWTGTNNGGIIRISGSPSQPEEMVFERYSFEDEKLNSISVLCLFIDSHGRLWAGTEGGGLNLYDPVQDRFIPVHKQRNLPGDAIFSIQEDQQGNLWMGTNVGLMKVHIPDDLSNVTYRLYTTSDGLQDNIFYRNTAFTDINGEMFFGGYKGYNSFFPDRMMEDESFLPISITDIKIYNQSWSLLDEKVQKKISEQAPDFTERIRLDYRRNNFSIEFAALSFSNPQQIKYAYMLQGFDTDWQYADASRHFAYYNNLKPGTYTFSLKSTNSNGTWNKDTRHLEVVILPPPWKSGWAYAGYALLLCLLAYIAYRIVHYRVEMRNALHLRELEQAKAEEVNHSKLQFFTNITHELLTPLTIISAAVDELKMITPQNGEYYQIMTSNINRLIRLLQQILEFRKAETGNLKLKVSQGDLASFIRNSVDSFRPLIKKKRMLFSLVCDPQELPAWFDPDKVDKILYNLLSNAAKYNEPGGTVRVELSVIGSGNANLIVRDNGKGLSPEAIKNLFKRFYEGDYRKFNTIGTGIGLSLTKDLVELHKGSISVSSKQDEGTAFSVVIPILREFYTPEEVDESLHIPVLPSDNKEEWKEPEKESVKPSDKENFRSLLLIEDNEDLLHLMTRLLSPTYKVYTAVTGKEGMEVIDREEIDLVVSDIMMPEMDGIEFCKQLKGHLETSHIPVVLLTAKNREEDRADAYDAGADGFIMKPFNLSVLHARINNLLKQKERMSGDFKKQLVFEANELNYTSLDENFLQQAIDCVNRHLSDPDFDQQAFLDEMGTSKSTLYRKLKSLTGLNSSAFIRNIRLKAACRIMEEKKHIRVSELAYAVGFNDPKYFSVCFKKEFGMQPSEYLDKFVPGHSE